VSELVALRISTEWMIQEDRSLGNAILLVLPTWPLYWLKLYPRSVYILARGF